MVSSLSRNSCTISLQKFLSSLAPPPQLINMPRRSSGGRPTPHPAARHSPPPQPVPPAPTQASGGGGGMLSGIGSTIAQGMAFGTGSAVAHRAVDVVLGLRTIQHEIVVNEAVADAPAPTTNSLGGSDTMLRN